MFDGDRTAKVVVLRGFAVARGLKPGDPLLVTMNGFRREFTIVGFAQSPEFLFTPAPGELAPDDARFAVLWMGRTALEAAFDMQGAFNEALLSVSRGTDDQAVMSAVDRVLDPYGGLGAYGIVDLPSNVFISEEIGGLATMSTIIPPVFLAVAAFLLYIVISRMVQAEREEIGLMKAFGYSNGEVGGHYFKMILSIAATGAFIGTLSGIAAGRAMVDLYLIYYKFPFLVFRLDMVAITLGFLVSVLAASAGGLLVLQRVFTLTPAVAMRAPAPADYSRAGRFGATLNRLLDQPTRMVLRRLMRAPGRMAGAVTGIAAGIALSAAMTSILANFDTMMALSFDIVDRSDLNVTFIHPIAARSAFDLQSLPGVIEVEALRIVPAILKNGAQSHRGAITGLITEPRLNRAVDADFNAIDMRGDGMILSTGLATTLGAKPGDVLRVDVREGRRPQVDIPIIAVAESLLGSPAYMEIGALNRILREPLRVSGAYVRVDASQTEPIYKALKDMPMVAGVSIKSEGRAAMQKITDQGAGAMRFVMAIIAAVISFGVVYNSARIAQAERARDLAGLRVLGFTRGEVAFVLLGELAVVILVALPLGAVAGKFLTYVIATGFSNDIYQIPASFNAASFGNAVVIVVIAAMVSGWLVKRDIDRADLVSAFKTRE
jgi:putative ABC transport system permease protein